VLLIPHDLLCTRNCAHQRDRGRRGELAADYVAALLANINAEAAMVMVVVVMVMAMPVRRGDSLA
jgi:hypothetical protein